MSVEGGPLPHNHGEYAFKVGRVGELISRWALSSLALYTDDSGESELSAHNDLLGANMNSPTDSNVARACRYIGHQQARLRDRSVSMSLAQQQSLPSPDATRSESESESL